MRTSLALVLLGVLACSGEADGPAPSDEAVRTEESMTPKEETEALMNAGIPFAEQMLSEHGEFYPYASAMRPTGEIAKVGYTDGNEHPAPSDVRDGLIASLRRSAERGEFKAIAIFTDVRVQPPSSDTKTDAVQVELEHRDGYSATVFFPYERDGPSFHFGDLFASARDNVVFTTKAK